METCVMGKKIFLWSAILGVVGVLLASGSAFACGRDRWGWYGNDCYGGWYRDYGCYRQYYVPYNDCYYAAPRVSYYYAAPIVANPAPVADYANIRVIVRDAQARVWFDGKATSQSGSDRLFSTPPLATGAASTYHVRAAWMQDGREVSLERIVSVTPGQTAVVDFTS
jgi:uncharacterized protein (TIGR03000 family)